MTENKNPDKTETTTIERPQAIYRITCPKCQGTGRQNKFFNCSCCGGKGWILSEK